MGIWSDINQALADARQTFESADMHATNAAKLVAPRLRQVSSPDTLRKMKADLQNFNAVTGKWKKPK